MSIDVTISGTDGKNDTNVREAQVHRRNGDTGLKVFTDKLHQRTVRFAPALSPTFGVDMAINAGFGGAPVRVHDGIDTTLWTGSQIVGTKTTFNSTDEADVGIRSVKTVNAGVGNIFEFDQGSNITVTSYVALSIRIFVESNWTVNDEVSVYPWDVAGGSQVGDAIPLSPLFNESEFGEWHSIIIPFEDFNFTASTFAADIGIMLSLMSLK